MTAKNNPGRRAGESQAVEWVRDYLEYSEPLTTEERSEVAAVSVVVELGYRPAVQCTSCGSWLVAPKSVALHRGPVCRSKDGDA